MLELKKLSPEELKSKLERLVRHERHCTTMIVEHLAEIDRRQSFIEWGFTSLYDYLTTGLKYSDSAACRRIQTARALRQVPELKEDLKSGTLSITQVSKAQTAFRQEERATGERVSVVEKRQVFEDLKNKTGAETQKILDGHMSTPHYIPTIRHKSDDSVEITLRIPKELMKRLDRVKELYSHIAPHGEMLQILELMANDVIRKRDPSLAPNPKGTTAPVVKKEAALKDSSSKINSDSKNETSTNIKTISKAVRRLVFRRDEGCQHKNPDGSKCMSRFQLQLDHIHPRFAGGRDTPENLRLLCRVHNNYRYKKGAGLSP